MLVLFPRQSSTLICCFHLLLPLATGDALGFARGFHHKGREQPVGSIAPHLLHAGSDAARASSILSLDGISSAVLRNADAEGDALQGGGSGSGSGHAINANDETGRVLDYDAAVRCLTAARFAIWDVIGASERSGSLDEAITNPLYNDVRRLLAAVPSIRRICFVTGVGSAKIFRRAWKPWLMSPGAFTVAPDRFSQEVFGKLVPQQPPAQDASGSGSSGGCSGVIPAPLPPSLPTLVPLKPDALEQAPHPVPHAIELVVMESVSPAHIPLVAATSNAKRVAAYIAEGRADLLLHTAAEPGGGASAGPATEAFAPRASAYAWKRAMWLLSPVFDDVPPGLLHPKARAVLPFGTGRPQDFVSTLAPPCDADGPGMGSAPCERPTGEASL